MKTIEQQKQELTKNATKLFNEGKTTDFVIEALKNYVINSNFSREINVDAIQYLAKQDLVLLK
jgi:hypothetical protein